MSEDKKKTIIEKIDQVHFDVPTDSLHNLIADALAVSAHIANGTEAKFTSKEFVAGTLDVIDGVKTVLKAKK